jgi:hypothetical protein
VVVPYSICGVEGWSVAQVIVADVLVILVAVVDEIIGAAGVAGVVKVKLADLVPTPVELVDSAA